MSQDCKPTVSQETLVHFRKARWTLKKLTAHLFLIVDADVDHDLNHEPLMALHDMNLDELRDYLDACCEGGVTPFVNPLWSKGV